MIGRKCVRIFNGLLISCVMILFLVGCDVRLVDQLPSGDPISTAIATLQPTNRVAIENPGEILEACHVEEQAEAMRPQTIPEWGTLDLNVCYDFEVDLQPEIQSYQGKGKIFYRNATGEELTDLILRTYPNAREIYGGQLQVSQVRVNGTLIEPEIFLNDRTAVRLPLKEPFLVDSLNVLEIEFNGHTAVDFNGQANVYGIFNYDSEEQVLTLANWFPIIAPWDRGDWMAEPVVGIGDAVVSDAGLYRLKVVAPAAWQVITTGVKLGEDRQKVPQGGKNIHHFASGPARDFMIVASPNLEMIQTKAEDILVRHWGLPEGKANWSVGLKISQEALNIFNDRFGSYPYAEIDTVAVPLNLASGVEYPGLILIDNKLYSTRSTRPGFFEIVISHEVAHQWWYGVVGNDVLKHPWQDEALTTFSSLLYQEDYQPENYQGTLDFYQNRMLELENSLHASEVGQPVQAFMKDPGAYGPVVYIKGALFFVELRQEIGNEAFFTALRAYYADNKYNLAGPQSLLQAFETSCSCQLDSLYQEWGVR